MAMWKYEIFLIEGKFVATCSSNYMEAAARVGYPSVSVYGLDVSISGAEHFTKRNGALYVANTHVEIPLQ